MERTPVDLVDEGAPLAGLYAPYGKIEDPKLAAHHRLWALLLVTLGPLALLFVSTFYVANPTVGVRGPTVLLVALLVSVGYALNRSPLFRWSPVLVIAGAFAAEWWNAWNEPLVSHAVGYYTLSLLSLQLSAFMLSRGATLAWFLATLFYGGALLWPHPELSFDLLVIPLFLLSFVTLLTQFALDARRRDREALGEARQRAEEASVAKSEFLAVMSHEIRTPLNAVLGMSELLHGTKLSEEQQEFADTIQASGEVLLDLLNGILDLSKIEAGALDIEELPFELCRSCERVIAVLAKGAEQKGVELRCRLAPSLPRWVQGDPTRFRQILSNLVANAIKFTEEGSVEVLGETVGETDEGYTLRFQVQDTGIGIPKESQPHLFERFRQVDASTTRRYGGTGLGLAIAKRLTELMGGSIGVESVPGVGSTFWVTLPFRRGSPPEVAAGDPPDLPLHVLVADDDAMCRRVASLLLERLGSTVSQASNGEEVLALLERGSFDVILMDCQMPVVDGYQATARIREAEEPSGRRVPIIALTANDTREDRDRCLAAGMDDLLAKPVSAESLAAIVSRLSLAATGAPIPHPASSAPVDRPSPRSR